jgi:hypothetical protein
MRPAVISPGGTLMRPMIVRALTDLPEPDSPTMAKVSPG